jgi:hypothetical protein
MSDQDKEVAYVDCDRCSDCRRLASTCCYGQRFVDKSTGSAGMDNVTIVKPI